MNPISIEAPAPVGKLRRLTPELKAVPANSNLAYELGPKTALCFVAYGRSKGWKTTRKAHGRNFLVWRTE